MRRGRFSSITLARNCARTISYSPIGRISTLSIGFMTPLLSPEARAGAGGRARWIHSRRADVETACFGQGLERVKHTVAVLFHDAQARERAVAHDELGLGVVDPALELL